MASSQPAVMKSLEHLFDRGPVTGLDDGQLLERFVACRDEAAFAALVALHGPLVLAVCSRILRDEHDIEDAFQATFLVLVQRAGSIRDVARLGPWLHGVARRVALHARGEAARRQARYCHSANTVQEVDVGPGHQTELNELRVIIDEEVARLPARYRCAVVLCDLEGRSYAVTARLLGCPIGTVQSRLARGRRRLRSRLIRRGIAPVALQTILTEGAKSAVPEALAGATVQAAVALVTVNAVAAGAISVRAAAIASSVINEMRSSMMRTTFAITAVSIAIGLGYGANIARSNSSAPATATGNVQQQQADEPDRDRTVHIQVLSKGEGSPLAGATVWVRAEGGRTHTWEGTTDAHGRYELVLPGQATTRLDVLVAHAGFFMGGLFGGPKAEYTISLERPEAIGGIVRDEVGRPIEGARVLASYYEPDLVWPEVYASLNSSLAVATTDAQGRWRADALPEHTPLNATLMVLATHADHIANRLQTTAGKGLAFGIEQVMKTGVSVSGTVLSPFGRPVPGATVVVSVPPSERMSVRLTTDNNGQFHSGRCFDPIRTKPRMTVLASGLAMAAQEIMLRQDGPAQVVQLSRRRPIEGRVVDAQGRPVAGALVSPGQSVFKGMLDWDAETGLDGRFVWHDAPTTGRILLDVTKPDYRPVRERAVDREAGELVIVLHRPQRLHGKVTDAETGRPVERFTMIHGSGPSLPSMRPAWNRDYTRSCAGGRFDLSYAAARGNNSRLSIRIEADGYEPVEFLGFPADAEDVERDFQLQKATPFSGVVRGPDDQPIADADLALAEIGTSVPLYYYWVGTPLNVHPPMRIRADGSGRYSFPTRDRKGWIVAAHKAGFALRSPEQLAASSDVKLVPWGRIEGVVKIGDKTAPSQRVGARLYGRHFSGVVEHTTRTDKDGRFRIDYVAPGVLTVGREVTDVRGGGRTLSNLVEIAVAPGQTVHVEVGGKGRPVIGRFALPGGAGVRDLAGRHVVLRSEPPALRVPDGFINFTDEQWSDWWDSFHASPEGRAYLAGDRQFAVAVSSDGGFRVEDVPAGRYLLKLTYRGSAGDGASGRLTVARAHVEVPEIPGGRSDKPLDMGAVPVEAFPFKESNVGCHVPEVIPNAGAGGALDLGAMRGKVVLLAFWSTRWSMAGLASLKAIHDAFGRDPGFVMIGLNEDLAPEAMKWCVARHHLAWEQHYLGSSDDENPIAAAFGVRYLPAVFLIGPDGRLIAKDLEDNRIKEAVAAALSKRKDESAK